MNLDVSSETVAVAIVTLFALVVTFTLAPGLLVTSLAFIVAVVVGALLLRRQVERIGARLIHGRAK